MGWRRHWNITMMQVGVGAVGVRQLGGLGAAVHACHGSQRPLDGTRGTQPQPLRGCSPTTLPQLPRRD